MRTLDQEIARLLEEGADPSIIEAPAVQYLLGKIVAKETYGNVDESTGEPDLIVVKKDGTFDIKTENIKGYSMERTPYNNIRIRSKEVEDVKNDAFGGERRKTIKEEVIIDQHGKVIDQNFASVKRHGFLA